MSGPTIVVHFGDAVSAADQAAFVVELDNLLNVDGEGKVKSQFHPGDEIYFLMHYDATKMTVTAVKSTSGEVVIQGSVSREKTVELLFEDTEDPVELQHTPSGGLSPVWYGRESALERSGRGVTAASVPCLGDITYSYNATSCRLVPPALTLEADEEFPIAVVIYVEATENE